ncbi:SigE family RNA polymerase sigma factor [Serinicoccus marinus]|uniref:SigE family RNA polymerase sigma factor n=1 Tax=Serinicoccus marinus TaxID=247333 RepID=UPI00248F5639|nr:SigE family RNA polymerase sigma factor [Serinicoccus marinus]
MPLTEPPISFTEFVLSHSDSLHRTAVLLTRDAHLAQDLLQESLLKAWRSWGRITDNAEGYVRTIMVREFLSSRRRRWHGEIPTEELPERAAAHDASAPQASGAPERAVGRLDLAMAIGALPPQQRAVVVLRYFHDLTEADTAASMDLAIGTVKSHHSRALAALRISSHLHETAGAEGQDR